MTKKKTVVLLCSSRDTGCGTLTHLSVVVNKNRGPWLVLTKTSPVTYKIQHHARAEPEVVE